MTKTIDEVEGLGFMALHLTRQQAQSIVCTRNSFDPCASHEPLNFEVAKKIGLIRLVSGA